MSAEVGAAVSEILDRAAKQYFKRHAPDVYHQYLWQVHGAGAVRHYDGSDVYWRRVQAALDFFFTSAQRVEIFRSLMQRADLVDRPECRGFHAFAAAETRLADLVASMALARSGPGGAGMGWDSIDRSYC